MHGADGAGVGVGALVAHHAHGHHRQQHRKRLPDFLVESGFLDFADDDLVTFAEQVCAFFGYFAENAHRQSGAGKGLTLQDVFRHSEVASYAADFVFK